MTASIFKIGEYHYTLPKAPPPVRRRTKRNPCALTIAQGVLGATFDRDNMTLRDAPVRLNDLMREVNAVRLAAGRSQVLYNPLWEVKP